MCGTCQSCALSCLSPSVVLFFGHVEILRKVPIAVLCGMLATALLTNWLDLGGGGPLGCGGCLLFQTCCPFAIQRRWWDPFTSLGL